MKAGNDTQKMLDGLNSRYKSGIGQGKEYYQILKNKKLNVGPKRMVMFSTENEAGSASPTKLGDSRTLRLEKLSSSAR